MAPDGTAFETAMSALVCTVTLPPAVGVLPIVKPENLTWAAVLATSCDAPLLMTMEVAPGVGKDWAASHDKNTIGEQHVEKKPDG
jgi:hypothetical protein